MCPCSIVTSQKELDPKVEVGHGLIKHHGDLRVQARVRAVEAIQIQSAGRQHLRIDLGLPGST